MASKESEAVKELWAGGPRKRERSATFGVGPVSLFSACPSGFRPFGPEQRLLECHFEVQALVR
jgi:hypothetical protein